MKNGVSQEDIIRGSREQKVKDVIFDAASLSYQHMKQVSFVLNSLANIYCLVKICMWFMLMGHEDKSMSKQNYITNNATKFLLSLTVM